ncbi:MAG: chemotaxis protein CheW [Deltaproteobacteria bacterium]|nr:chemotaxis protein CheW [Deltaproteobacteria bacterium]
MNTSGENKINLDERAERDILRWRALRLARSLRTAVARQRIETFLEFRMMGLRYAVYLNRVVVVRKVDDVFDLPNTPPHITGLIQHRGQAIVLISLPRFFYPNARGIADADYAMVVQVNKKRFALQVEDIEGVRPLDSASLSTPSESLASEQVVYISVVTADGLAVVDLEKVVQAEGFALS